MSHPPAADPAPTLTEITRVFARIGLLSFGGPAAQIALMHRVLVDERGWLDEARYLSALSFCMILPGPEAMQLATYAGWRLHGIRGGLIAGGLFVLPGALVILALAAAYAALGGVPLVGALFLGVQAAAVVIVIEALLRVARRALKQRRHWLIAGLAFAAIFAFALPFPAIILLAGLWGALRPQGAPATAAPALPAGSLRHSTITAGLGLALWLAPFALLAMVGAPEILTEIGAFFSKLAVVTFGGAYAVLAYMAQDVVTRLNWLEAAQMIDALGLAETTPGPLILVTEFVGFLAGFGAGGYPLALAGAALTIWVTFVPCFIWIFAGAPYLDHITAQPRLSSALTAITAAVVGVILNLSLWFALHVIFASVTQHHFGLISLPLPDPGSVRPAALALIALAAWLLLRRHAGLGLTLTVSAVAALALHLLPI